MAEQQERDRVYTGGLVMRNSRQEKPIAVTVTFMDDSMRLQFSPELPKSEQSETRRYDYKNSIFTGVTRTKARNLVDTFKEVFLPALKEKKECSISIPIASINQLQLSTNIVNGEPHPVLRFIQNIDENTLTAKDNDILTYEFSRGENIIDYDPKTGSFGQRLITHDELMMFMNDIDCFNDATSHTFSHNLRTIERSFKDNINMKLNRIGDANGVHFEDLSSNRRPQRGSIYDKHEASTPAPSQSISSMEELDKAMGNGPIPESVDEIPFN